LAVTATNGRRIEYEANGWIVRSHRPPADVPVLIHNATLGGLVFALLNSDGGVQAAGIGDAV
jgi:hypothetical protein